MKKLVLVLAVTAALTGCVTNPPVSQHNKQFDVQASALRAELDSGKITRTAYYERLYDITLNNSQATSIARYRVYVADMIPIARKLDAGQISQAQFEDESRRLHSAMMADMEREQQARAEMKRRQDAQSLQNTQQALQLLNANRPPPPAFAPNVQCRSRNVYGTIYTDCN